MGNIRKNTMERNSEGNFLIFLCWIAYTSAYIARLNYNASIVGILSQLNVTKEAAGAVSSWFFFAYGAGQLVNGLLCKKYNTRYSVAAALVATCVVNLAMTFCRGIDAMKYLWFVNGAFQSVLWSSLIKTISDNLSDSKISRAVMVMGTTVASGTFAAYGLAALFLHLGFHWTVIFYVASLLTGAVAVLWFTGMRTVQKEKKETEAAETGQENSLPRTPAFAAGAAVIVICAVSNGFIKDGITTWVPSILKEEFGVPASLSIMITLLLPVLAILGTSLVNALHSRQKDCNVLNGIFYFASVILVGLILLTMDLRSVPLTLGLFAGIACLMSAVNTVITGIVPLYSRDRVDSGLLAGVLNTFCYVGSALATSQLGKIADARGWKAVLICLLVFTFAAFAVCCVSGAVRKKEDPSSV